jgi:hypothetical protein
VLKTFRETKYLVIFLYGVESEHCVEPDSQSEQSVAGSQPNSSPTALSRPTDLTENYELKMSTSTN